ncbi:PilZ domain-containing protein [Amphritea balenae]|mgnify:CR=1 FL=1|uniref:PilZ domain-containing protein n=1 Tax=Amphritea balenae TaxID=452629 RepID=A0A3P1SXJ3_9GAMM|nr:PilZ domain-containing protein [Amphritea balenae]RRD01705.1 PilZ domain-containing protein [Amphritea balenae]GGK54841.1 hypothetical protein GCM10007941_01080 [Amphritea balenae]
MEIISDDSLELEEIPGDSEAEQVTRKFYRLPVKRDDSLYLEVDCSRFPLLDISESGVCVAVEADTEFPQDARLRGCSLVLRDKTFADMEGEIVHISVDGDGNWVSGIQWIIADDVIQAELNATLADLRKEFFKDV